jgi:serine/threonine-protein kinase
LLDAARRAGVLKPAEWSSRRDAWIAKWTKLSASKSAARDVVVAAYVWPAETREDAEEAVRRLPELVPLSSTWARSGDFLLGKAYFLAGRIDDAVPYLQRAAASCEAFERPFPTTRAALMLGQALEQQHDAARACDAYGRVTARWGHAKPRSVSAEAARDGMKRLACAG